MVVFTCGHCGESVQKPKVEKHYLTKCRNRNPNLSCMDCFKDFVGPDYEGHIKCITEEQRYSGKGFVAKEKKGEKKQNAWVEMLQSVLEEQKNAPKNVLRIVEIISKHNNTPRKKPKFFNFVKNVCGHKTSPKDIEQAWDMISVKLSALSNVNNQNQKEEVVKREYQQLKEENNEAENNSHSGAEEQTAAVKDDIKSTENLSKKQRKEEKKRKKYEAELEKAALQPIEIEEVNKPHKKEKKNRKKSESQEQVEETASTLDSKTKISKRKRQDTVNVVQEIIEANNENIENVPINKEKNQKKKLKIGGDEETEDSICLHEQNVASTEEPLIKSDKFDWHAVILSVLEKKGKELPFKRLQKKVLSEYTELTGREVDDRIADKFIKKLKSAPNVRVDKNRVLLIE